MIIHFCIVRYIGDLVQAINVKIFTPRSIWRIIYIGSPVLLYVQQSMSWL